MEPGNGPLEFWKTIFLYNPVVFGFHVDLPECNSFIEFRTPGANGACHLHRSPFSPPEAGLVRGIAGPQMEEEQDTACRLKRRMNMEKQ